jgi:hypothetical protein
MAIKKELRQFEEVQKAIYDMEKLLIELYKRGEYYRAVYVFQAMDMLCDKFRDIGVQMPDDAVAINIDLDEKLNCDILSL